VSDPLGSTDSGAPEFHSPRRPGRGNGRWSLSGTIGAAIVAANLLVAALGGLVAPHSAGEFVTDVPFAPPAPGLIFGSDYLGRDVLSRMLHGAGLTIGMSALSTIVGFAIGMPMGFVAAARGGWVDGTLSRSADTLISIPPILLALLLTAGLGSSFVILIIIVGLVHAPRVLRISRAIAADISALDFVEAARARGESTLSIIAKDIWPNAVRPLLAEFGLRLTFSVLLVSSISFIGIGLPPPTSDWGSMVRENLGGLYDGSCAVVIPALAIGVLSVGIMLVVDWLGRRSGRDISQELA
jgi:peptide/nickel transport system permease protein